MPRPILLALSMALGLGVLAMTSRADDGPPASLVFVSSDFSELPREIALPKPGEYTVKGWGFYAGFALTLKAEGPPINLVPTELGSPEEKPRWRTLGKITIGPDCRASFSRREADPFNNVDLPALLSLSTDPDFLPTKALDILRGQIKSTAPTADLRRTTSRTNQEGADFQPPISPQAWRDRAATVREQLLVALGLRPMPPKTDLLPLVIGTLEREGYAIDKVVLETYPGFYLTGNVYRPTTPGGRRPVVMCPHGHWPEGRVNVDVQSRCVRLAQLGCIVFLYDMVGYADNKPFGHAFSNDRIRRWGLSLPGLQTWNSIRALDWLVSRSDVDPTRVAITGESGGATQTLLLTAVDDRIKVSAPVVMVSDTFQGGSPCENAAGLRIGTDNIEIAALMAPRPMKIVGASGDWTARTMTNAFPSLQMVYAQAGATTHLEADVFDFPHNYNQTSRNAVYAFLAKWLLGPMDAEATREGAVKTEDPKDLFAFDAEHPYPPGARTPEQLESDLIGLASRELEGLAPNSEASWEAARGLLGGTLKVRVGLEMPVPRESTAKEIRKVSRDGLTIIHYTVGRKGKGDLIPVVRLTPAHPNGRLTVVFTARGKADLTTPEGSPTPIAKALLDRGQSVVGFDPLFVGESHDPLKPATARPSTGYFDCYNPTLPADRAQDLATVFSWARALADVREVNLVANGGIGPLGLLARPRLEGISRTVVDLGGFDYGDGSKPVPPTLDLPGVLQFGGLKVAAALISPAPLWVVGASDRFDANWALQAYELLGSKQFRLDRGQVEAESIAKWIDLGE
jgi:hypothetical protein